MTVTMVLMKKPDETFRTSCSNRQSRHRNRRNNRKYRHKPRPDRHNPEKHKRRNQSWQTGRRLWIMENTFAVQRWQKRWKERRSKKILPEFLMVKYKKWLIFSLKYHIIILTGLPTPLTQVMCPMGRHFYFWRNNGEYK